MSDKKKIAVIIQDLACGGAEKVASILSRGLSKTEEVYVILDNDENMAYPAGGSVISLGIKKSKNSFNVIMSHIKRIYRLRKLKRRLKIDVCISLLSNPNIANILSSSKGEKTIISVHSFRSIKGFIKYNLYEKLYYYPQMKIFYRFADAVVGVSRPMEEIFLNDYHIAPKKIFTIHNPLELDSVKEMSSCALPAEYANILTSKRAIITVGSVSEAKAQWHLIRAFKKIHHADNDTVLFITGSFSDIKLKEKLERLVIETELTDCIYFTGHQKNPFNLIAASKVFVLSSITEGFGNVIVEALSCQTPVVSTDCLSGPRDILAPDTDFRKKAEDIEQASFGILVPSCDGIFRNGHENLTEEEELMADAVLMLLNNEKLSRHYSSSGLIRAADFEAEKIISQWNRLINL